MFYQGTRARHSGDTSPQILWFSYGFFLDPMVFLWFSNGFPMVFQWFSYGFPSPETLWGHSAKEILWFSYGFYVLRHFGDTVPRKSYGFPMVFQWFSYGFLCPETFWRHFGDTLETQTIPPILKTCFFLGNRYDYFFKAKSLNF